MAANKGGRVKSDRGEQEWFRKRRIRNRRAGAAAKVARRANRSH